MSQYINELQKVAKKVYKERVIMALVRYLNSEFENIIESDAKMSKKHVFFLE